MQAPPGGPPDKTPPAVVAVSPPTRTVQFAGASVVLELSEYVDRSSAQSNIFISPPVKYSTDWHGRSLEIEFDEPLQPQTTYAVTLGTEFADRAGNKPQQSYTLTFSTGDRLDSGVVHGYLTGEKAAGAFVFLYPLSGIDADTLNPAATRPKYRTQVGAAGAFEFQALPAGAYRLLAVGDEFRNELFDAGVDAFGTTTQDVVLAEGQTRNVSLRIGPAHDSTAPEMYSAQMSAKQTVRVEFSEALDTVSIAASSFAVVRDGAPVAVRSAFLSPSRRFSVNILTDSVAGGGLWKVTATDVRDSAGNAVSDTARTAEFVAPDSSAAEIPVLVSLPFADSASSVHPAGPYRIVWSTAVDKAVAGSAVQLKTADSAAKSVEFELQWPQDNIVDVLPRVPLAGNTAYKLAVRNGAVRDVLGRSGADTVVHLFFRTVDPGNYGIVAGTVVDADADTGCRYVLSLRAKDGSRQFRLVLPAAGPWEIRDVPPGTYTLTGFCDADNNGVYSFGRAFPYRTAERFADYGVELVVRPRWTMENIVLTFRP